MRRTSIVLLGFVTCAASAGTWQDARVTSARAWTAFRDASIEHGWIVNRRDTPIVGWEIRGIHEGRRVASLSARYAPPPEDGEPARPPGTGGPILPGEGRRVRLTPPKEPAGVEYRLVVALFADGSFAGEAASLERILARQDARAAELEYWIQALLATPRSSPQDAFAFLRRHAAERTRQMPRNPFDLGRRIESWISSRQASRWTDDVVDLFRASLERELAAATRHRTHLAHYGVGTMTIENVAIDGVDLHLERSQQPEPVAYIENLRNVPLDAWALRVQSTDPAGGPGGGQWIDACGRTERPGEGRIQPGELREILVSWDTGSAHLPRAVLEGALWSDGHVEGRAGWREELAARRRADGQAIGYWIPLLREAAAMPAQDAVRFLRQKDEERARDVPREIPVVANNLTGWTRIARDPDGDLGAVLTRYVNSLEYRRVLCGPR